MRENMLIKKCDIYNAGKQYEILVLSQIKK
jgi:hypothetical protein